MSVDAVFILHEEDVVRLEVPGHVVRTADCVQVSSFVKYGWFETDLRLATALTAPSLGRSVYERAHRGRGIYVVPDVAIDAYATFDGLLAGAQSPLRVPLLSEPEIEELLRRYEAFILEGAERLSSVARAIEAARARGDAAETARLSRIVEQELERKP